MAELHPFPRSWLFVPALRAGDWLPKAQAAGADAAIVDLEDSTAPGEKDHAREELRALRPAGRGQRLIVRVNAAPADHHRADLHAAADAGAEIVLLPKVGSVDDLEAAALLGFGLVPIIETPAAVLGAAAIAAHPRVVGLAFGSFDLATALGARPGPDGLELLYARSAIVLAAANASVGAIDTPWLDIADAEGAGREADRARAFGFAGKLAIHPNHVAPINAAFLPTADEVTEAREIVAAFNVAAQAGSGVTVVRGRMIDRPLALAALDVIGRAERAK